MPKITQFDKVVFLYQYNDFQGANSWKLGSRSGRPKKLSTLHEQDLNVMSLRNTTQDLRDAHWPFSWLIYYSLKPCQKWSQWKGSCKEAILKEKVRNSKKRLRHARLLNWTEGQWHQVLYYECKALWMLFWNVLQEAQRLTPEDNLKKWKEACLSEFQVIQIVQSCLTALQRWLRVSYFSSEI